MNSAKTVYIGMDPTLGNKDFGYAILDDRLSLLALNEANRDEISSIVAPYDSVCVAVCAPERVNKGLVKKKFEKETKPGHSLRGVDIRMVEFELRGRGITITGTPSRAEFCPAWMRVGFALYEELSNIGFEPIGRDDAEYQYFETNPYASFCALIGGLPLSRLSLEGRLQRQLVLYDKGVGITDGMQFFEEITRFKLLRGILPEGILYTLEELNVLVAAYAAWVSVNQPEDVTQVGEVVEGQMILPVSRLHEKYS